MPGPHPAAPSTIEMNGATALFDTGDGVHDLDMSIASGTIFGFIGPSGAGKTTAVRLLTGALRPGSGTVTVLGTEPAAFSFDDRSRIGYLPQSSVLYPTLTVEENLRFFASLYGVHGRGWDARCSDVLEFVELGEDRSKRIDEISGGMRRRLGLAAAMIHDPEVLFLDEPTAGIDPILRRTFWERFASLRDGGTTLFITTQYVGEAAECDVVGVLSSGRLIASATPRGLAHEAYGGDVVSVRFTRPPDGAELEDLRTRVGAVDLTRTGYREIRLTVAVGEAAIEILDAAEDLTIERSDLVLPSYDDVFVRIVSQAEKRVDR